jgi:hypothetical protein
MEVYRPLRAGLCIYECVRLLSLLGAFALLRPDGEAAAFPWSACVASNALFPLMALFLWLDSSRYSVYEPLYTAGKCVCFVSVMSWCIFSRQIIITTLLSGGLFIPMIMGITGMLFGDLLSVAAGLAIIKKTRTSVQVSAPAGGE